MKRLLILLAAFATLPNISEAKGFRLAPAEPLRSNATMYEVKGRQGLLIRQRLSFGPYATPYVRRSAITRWGGGSGVPGVIWAEHMRGRQSIRFGLSDGTDTIFAETVTHVKSSDLVIGDNRNSLPNVVLDVLSIGSAGQENNFSAMFTSGKGREWELFLDNTAAQLRRDEPAGFLRSNEKYYSVVPVWKVERKGKVSEMLFGAIGLEFRDETGVARVAVSLTNNGEVYLDSTRSSAEQLLLSSACAALLLQSTIE